MGYFALSASEIEICVFDDLSTLFWGLQVYCIFMFLTAASFFGILISQLNEIVAKQTLQTKELDENLECYLNIQPGCVSLRFCGSPRKS